MRRFSVAGVAFLLLVGCGDADPPSALAPEDAVLRAYPHADEMVPIHWSYHVTPAGTDMIQCFTESGDPVTLPDGSSMMVGEQWQFTGHLSYTDRLDPVESRARFEDCVVSFDGTAMTSMAAPTVAHLANAAGDAVDLEGTLVFDLTIGVGVAHWTITGGTGIYRGAEGFIDTREYPVGMEGEATYGIGAGMVTRPAVIDGRPLQLSFTFGPDPSGGTCDVYLPDGSVIPLPRVSHGEGQASHMGRSSITITHEWCRIDPARGIVSGGNFETIGANGDAVTGVWDGYTAADGRIALVGWIDDGTGRFDTAYGELHIDGVSDPGEGGWFEAGGRIGY